MLVRPQSVGCVPPSQLLPTPARPTKPVAEVLLGRPLGPFISKPSGSGRGTVTVSAYENGEDVTASIEGTIEATVRDASELMAESNAATPVDVSVPTPADPEPLTQLEEVSAPQETLQDGGSTLQVSIPTPEKDVQIASGGDTLNVSIPAPETSAQVPEGIDILNVSIPVPETSTQVPEGILNVSIPAPERSVQVLESVALDDSTPDPINDVQAPESPFGLSVGEIREAAGQALEDIKSALSVETDGGAVAPQASEDTGNVFSLESFQEVTDQVFEDVKEAASSSLDSILDSVSDAVVEKEEVLGKKLEEALDLVGSKISSGYDSAIGSALDAASDTLEAAKKGTESNVVAPLQTAIDSGATQAASSVSPEVRDVVGAGVKTVVDHPIASLATVGTLLGAYTITKIGKEIAVAGYVTTPPQAFSMLQAKEIPTLLVDVRSDEERMKDGIPSLKRNAYGRGVAVTPYKLPPAIARAVRNPRDVETAINATYIGDLKQASYITNFIIMGSKRDDCVPLVKALQAIGFAKVTTLKGGFAAWKDSGLPVEEGEESSYDVGAIDSVVESAQTLADSLEPLKSPSVFIPASAGVAAAGWALFNFQLVLKYIGVFGPLATVAALVANRYDSPEQFVEEIGDLVQSAYDSANESANGSGPPSETKEKAAAAAAKESGKVKRDAGAA